MADDELEQGKCEKCGLPTERFLGVWFHHANSSTWCPKQGDYALAGEAKD